MTFVRRMTWQSELTISINNRSNRNLLGWMRSPCKGRRQKSRKWPVDTKMTVRTTIRAIGDNPVAIAGRAEVHRHAPRKFALEGFCGLTARLTGGRADANAIEVRH